MMQITASERLLISQWRSRPIFSAMVRETIAVLQSDVADPLGELERMTDVDQAKGVWLDFLAARVGITRPLVEDPAQDKRFGFDDQSQSSANDNILSFDEAPFRGILSDSRYPLSDAIFRRFVKARGLLDTTRGEFAAFERAIQIVDADAKVVDNRDMTIKVLTDLRDQIELADEIGALPRAAGITLVYSAAPRFGFEGTGSNADNFEGFDQARMKT